MKKFFLEIMGLSGFLCKFANYLLMMSNTFFSFKQFTIHQEHCAMKVGTDGTLLGAWARGGQRILDVGTGTGLIALMLAQRFSGSQVVGIDIDEAACRQAAENVAESPFTDQISIRHVSLQEMGDDCFDSVVSNPPFFSHSLTSPDERRTMARHADTLSYHDLFTHVSRLLSADGEFSVIVPVECKECFDEEAVFSGFFPLRECAVKTTEQKAPRRYLLSYTKQPAGGFERTTLVIGSEAYRELVKDFYIRSSF